MPAETKTIIKEVTPTLHTFSRPFKRFGVFKIGARMTALVLSDGSLALTSPISISSREEEEEGPGSGATQGEVEGAVAYVKTRLGGRVRLIIAPDLAHYLSVSAWSRAFPEAKCIGVEGHAAKCPDVKWDLLFSASTDAAAVARRYGVEGQLAFRYFHGFKGRDLVTFHAASRSIVEADLVFNLPAREQYGGVAPTGLGGWMNVLRKDSVWSRRILWALGKGDRGDMARGAADVLKWGFENIVPCHGDLVLGDGKQVWAWVFERYLKMPQAK